MNTRLLPTFRITNLLLLFGTITVLLVTVEFSVRALLFFRTPSDMIFNKEIIYEFKPHGSAYGVTFNNIGCIGDDLTPEKRPTEFRVFLLGGSTSFSVDYVNGVKHTLQQRMPRRNVIVSSCGRPRYTSHINSVNLQTQLLRYSPDVVVLYMGINDNIYNTFPWVTAVPTVGFFDWRTRSHLVSLQVFQYYLIDKALRSHPRFAEGELRSPALFARNVDAIIQACRSRNIHVVLATFAIATDPQDSLLARKLQADEPIMRHFWGDRHSTAVGVAAHNRIMKKLALQYRLPLAPVHNAIPHDSRHFLDLCHLTTRGYDLLARSIADAVVQTERNSQIDLHS